MNTLQNRLQHNRIVKLLIDNYRATKHTEMVGINFWILRTALKDRANHSEPELL